MRYILIIILFVLLAPYPLWAITNLSDTTISGYVDVSDAWSPGTLQGLPPDQRFGALNNPPATTIDNFRLDDINQVEVHLKGNLQLFSNPSFQIPSNVSGPLKDYLTNAPADTQQMIYKLDNFKLNLGTNYEGHDYSGFTSPRSFNIFPLELPPPAQFTPQEQIWEQKGIPFGRLGIGQEPQQTSKAIHQIKEWNFELGVYDKDKWQLYPGYKFNDSLGLNGPLVVLGKGPQGPDLSVYSFNGDFVGDVTKAKLGLDPAALSKYILKADYPLIFGTSKPYDHTQEIEETVIKSVAILRRFDFLEPDWSSAEAVQNELNYNEDYWNEAEDCMDPDYYEDHVDECENFYEGARPPYSVEYIKKRQTQDNLKDPNNPLYPNPVPKPAHHSLFGNILMSVLPVGGGISVTPDSTSSGEVNVTDQYYLPKIGFTDMSDTNSAWNAVDTKGPNVTIAVIDSGMDLTHPDGPQFLWTNPANGSHGWNFIDENTDLRDLHDHGTLVAGIIAAKTNSGIGIAGINKGAVIMPLKVADKDGIANSLNIYRAIHYAVDHGARIINISLGDTGASQLENLAINYARSRNCLVVIASGNDAVDIDTYGPSSSSGALAVGALNFDGSLATVSNWGANNFIMAPGEQIYSLHSKDAPWDGPAMDRDHLYTKESGTSFAAPMVTGTASLMLVKNPNLTVEQMEDILLSTAKPLDKDRWNGKTGAGLLDAARALRTGPQGIFNVRITRIKKVYRGKRKIKYVEVFATLRGKVDYFTVEIGRGKYTNSFRPVIGFSGQQANDDLVAHITDDKLRGSSDWVLAVRALDKNGNEYLAKTPLTL